MQEAEDGHHSQSNGKQMFNPLTAGGSGIGGDSEEGGNSQGVVLAQVLDVMKVLR